METISIAIEERLSRIESLLNGNKNILTFNEVSAFTGLSKSYLYKLTSTGGIPCYKPQGKHLYFEKAELNNWLLRNRIKTNEEIEQEASTLVTMKGGQV